MFYHFHCSERVIFIQLTGHNFLLVIYYLTCLIFFIWMLSIFVSTKWFADFSVSIDLCNIKVNGVFWGNHRVNLYTFWHKHVNFSITFDNNYVDKFLWWKNMPAWIEPFNLIEKEKKWVLNYWIVLFVRRKLTFACLP